MDLTKLTPTKRASIIAILTAACVASNYALVGVLNVNIMDVIVFITGLVFGPIMGMTVGFLSWIIYGIINPYGFSLPILLATAGMETLYGLVGGYMGKNNGAINEESSIISGLKFAFLGFILTFAYDLVTNLVMAATFGIDYSVALVSGIPWAITHELSNAVLFFIGVIPSVKGIHRVIPEMKVNVKQE